ncbi:MAG TPA: 3-deoxy-D-manno-octulosonic acid transferase [Gemmataceae bacterium]|nr:3-deoxy-D-manno-octulosonic acid transferase [Gemmataceae bacterium]
MRFLLDAAYLVALLAFSPWLLYKALRTGKYRLGLKAKLSGLSPSHLVTLSPCHPVWFHGVSVGEVHLLRQVIAAFRRRHPGRPCVVSATTDTGFAEARRCFPDLTVIHFPFDFSWAVARTLRSVRPALVVLAESELWPNFLTAARRQGVPVALINGRMSPRTFARYRRLGPLARWLFGRLDLLAMQTEEYARAVRALGVPAERVRVTGSVKFDGTTADRRNPRTEELRRLFGVTAEDLVWVAGSTQAPEEEIALAVYRRAREAHPNLRLFLVPRQKDRFDEVARLLERSGLPFVRRSALPSAFPIPHSPFPIVLVDTIGELGALWGLADVAFVGGSMDGRRGGQNMIEPAAYGAAVVFGPHVWNFRDVALRLVQGGAARQVGSAEELETVVCGLLADAAERQRLGAAASAFVRGQQGATERTLDLLDALLAGRGPSSQAA